MTVIENGSKGTTEFSLSVFKRDAWNRQLPKPADFCESYKLTVTKGRIWPLVNVARLRSFKLWSTQETPLLVVSNSRNRWSGQPEYAALGAGHL